jgi:glycosyltransferase involved in cell wall biosynthesis
VSAPRLLYLGNSLDVGGSEVLGLELFRRLHPGRFRIEGLCLKHRGRLAPEYEAAGIRIDSDVLRSRFDPLGPFRLARVLAGRRFDLLLVEPGRNALLAARLARRLGGARAVVSWVKATGKWGRSRQFNRTERILLGRLDAVVVIAESQRRHLVEREGLDPANLRLIPNGVDPERFRPRPELRTGARAVLGLAESEVAIGIVASLTPEKGHAVLIDAFARLRAEGLPVRLLVAGEGPERPAIEADVARRGLQASVSLLGLRRDLDRHLHPALDLLALASHPFRETFPVSVLEAMASGLPVVATRVGSVAELVVDGETGTLVAPGDPGALAAALRGFATRPARRAAHGAAARERVERRFTLDRMVEAYAELFEGLVSPGASGRRRPAPAPAR